MVSASTHYGSPLEVVSSRILLALRRRVCPRPALLRTLDLAQSLDTPIEVLRVLPDRLRWARWLPKALLNQLVQRQMHRARVVARASRYELAPVYADDGPRGQVVVRTGSFVREVIAHARRREPELIVLTPDERRIGALATELALATRRRIFIPRAACRSRIILAASDLATPGLPVLEEGTRLAKPLSMDIVPFHNVDPLYDAGDDSSRVPPGPRSLPARVEEAHESLSAIGRAAVRSGIDAAAGILSEAHERQVDLVIVGVKLRTRLERLIYGSVAARVVDRAPCSVLVTPVPVL